MDVSRDELQTPTDRNKVNTAMRATPEWRNAIQALGHNPDGPLKLSKAEQQQLTRTLGLPADDFHIDPAGNINDFHGWKGLPTWAKTAIVAGAVVGTAGAAGAFAGGAGAASAAGGAGGTLAGTSTVPAIGALAGGVASGAVPAAAAGVGTAATAAGLSAGVGSGVGATGLAGGALPSTTLAGSSTLGGTGFVGGAAGVGPTSSYVSRLATLGGDSGGGGAMSGLGGDAARYGLQYGGNLAGQLIQAHAAGKASDAQQKYLEEALAYQKEQDTYIRTRQTGLDAQEVSRYGDYQGRIAPFIANGTSSNDRMAALLGLPARSGGSSGSSGGNSMPGDPIAYADRLSAADKLKVDALLKASNSNDNPAYWYGVNAQHGGFDATGADWNQHRISIGDGVGKGYAGAPTAPPTAQTPMSPASTAMVTMRAPDGSQKSVPQSQVAAYTAKGATVIGAGAA
jgi:hypothetical protein